MIAKFLGNFKRVVRRGAAQAMTIAAMCISLHAAAHGVAADEVQIHLLSPAILQERTGTSVTGSEGLMTGPRLAGAATVRWDEGVELRIVQIGTPVRPELESQERVQLAALVAGVETFEAMGNRGMTQLAIAGLAMQRVAPSWTLTLSPEGLLFRASVRAEDLAGAVQQLVDIMREAPFDERQFEQARAAAIEKRVQLEASPQQAIGDLLAKQMTPTDDPRLRRATAEDFASINAQQAHDYLKLHFATRRIDMAAVSTARLASVLGAMEPVLGPLLATGAGERLMRTDGPSDLRMPARSIGGHRQVIQPAAGSGGVGLPGQMLVTFTQPAPAQREMPATVQTQVASRALQEEIRAILMREQMQAKLVGITTIPGRTYPTLGVTVMTFVVPTASGGKTEPPGGQEGAGQEGAGQEGVGREGVGQEERAGEDKSGGEAQRVMDQLDRLIDQAVTGAGSDERVAAAKVELAKEQRRRLSQFEHLATALAMGRYVGLGLEDVIRGPQRLDGVTVPSVQERLAKDFAGAKRSIVALQPGR